MLEIELPEFLEGQTYETILQRIMNALPPDMDKSEGSYIWDSISPVAVEIALVAEWAKEVIRRSFTKHTFGDYLTMRAEEEGLIRRGPVKSSGYVTFTGKENTIISLGTRVSTPSDNTTPAIEFQTTEEAKIGITGSAVVAIESLLFGAKGDVEPGTISILVSTDGLSGVASVTNENKTTGGFDEEDDDSLRSRIFENSKKDEGDGNIDDYAIWAKEVSGVGNVLVEPHWSGPGTMRVVILDQSGDAASLDLINEVQEHLDPGQKGIGEGRAPVGSKTTVNTATVISVAAIIPSLIPESGYTLEQARTNAEGALRSYLKNINPGGVIRVREAAAEIINAAGVLDTGDLLLNNSRGNITLSTTELADLGSVNYT